MWRLLREGDSLWGRIVCSEYGDKAQFGEEICYMIGSNLWKDLGKMGECSEKGVVLGER